MGWALWFCILVLVALYVLTYNFPVERIFPAQFQNGPAEFQDRVRWFGILLEAVAISTIAIGLNESRAAFGKPSLIRSFLSWITELRYVVVTRPPIYASVHMKAEAGSIAMAGGVATMTGGNIEDRVGYLERSLKEVQQSVGEIAIQAKKTEREIRAALEKEAQERRSGDQAVSQRLEEQSIGDIKLQVSGLALLLISIFMANAPAELAFFLRKLGLG
jgi:hypothetical protein